jgi:NAD(P)H-hydrate epimerase
MQEPLSIRPLKRAEVRQIDRRAIDELQMTGLMLMENAGRGCAEVLCKLGCRGPVVVVCGKGNNAGDGYVIARHLDLRGIKVKIVQVEPSETLTGDAARNYGILWRSHFDILELSQPSLWELFQKSLADAEWAVDALLGTGSTGAPRPPVDQAFRLMNAASPKRLAVDLPSGLDCDTGMPADPTFQADHTCTFVAEKVGFFNPAARPCLGQVHVVHIGVPSQLLFETARAGP